MLELSTVAAMAGLVLAPLPSRADPLGWGWHPLVQAGLNACGGDVARICPDVVPGGGRIAQCLSDHHEALSPPCRTFMRQAKDARLAIFACSGDASRLCGGVLPGGGRIVACLKGKLADVSPTCKDGLNRVSAEFDR